MFKLYYKLEPVGEVFWLMFKELDEDGLNWAGNEDMGSQIDIPFDFMEQEEDEDSYWFAQTMNISNPEIPEFNENAIKILQHLNDRDFTSNIKSVIEFAEELAEHDSRIFSYALYDRGHYR